MLWMGGGAAALVAGLVWWLAARHTVEIVRAPCVRPADAVAPRSARTLVLVTVDTLRADHLGAYGYARARTPRIDGLAASGMRFVHAGMFGYVRSGRTGGRHCLNGPRYSLCAAPDEPARLYDHVADPALRSDVSDRYPEIAQRLRVAAAVWTPSRARERTVRSPEFKLVEYPRLEGGYRRALYDLRADPGETIDVSSERPEVTRSLAARLERWSAELVPEQPVEPSADQIEALRALGYVD
jgi:hypothetical protein